MSDSLIRMYEIQARIEAEKAQGSSLLTKMGQMFTWGSDTAAADYSRGNFRVGSLVKILYGLKNAPQNFGRLMSSAARHEFTFSNPASGATYPGTSINMGHNEEVRIHLVNYFRGSATQSFYLSESRADFRLFVRELARCMRATTVDRRECQLQVLSDSSLNRSAGVILSNQNQIVQQWFIRLE